MREGVIQAGEGITGRAFAAHAPVWVRDLSTEPGRYQNPATDDAVRAGVTRGTLAVPIVTGDTVYGVLAVGFTAPHDFTPDEIGLLTSFAHQAAMAIEKQSLLEASQAREREATRLYEVTAALAAAHDIEGILDLITAKAVELLGCDAAGMLRYDPAANALTFVREFNLPGDLRKAVVRPGEGMSGRAFSELRPVWTRDFREGSYAYDDASTATIIGGLALRAVLAVPIVTPEGPGGVLAGYFFV